MEKRTMAFQEFFRPKHSCQVSSFCGECPAIAARMVKNEFPLGLKIWGFAECFRSRFKVTPPAWMVAEAVAEGFKP